MILKRMNFRRIIISISEEKIYSRTGDTHAIYLKPVIANPNIKIGDYTMYMTL